MIKKLFLLKGLIFGAVLALITTFLFMLFSQIAAGGITSL